MVMAVMGRTARRHSRPRNLAGKRVVVLSDHLGLHKALETSLHLRLGVEVVSLPLDLSGPTRGPTQVGDCDLIVLAMSSLTSEAVVALAQTSLLEHVGRVPLLIISDRPFRTDPLHRIAHLDFPFDLDSLCDKVEEIL